MRTILGVAVGATLTPAVLATLPAMWPTLVLVPLMVAAIALIGVPYFRRVCGYDFPTAYYATMPGGLQDMIVFGEEAASVRSLSLIHATRVMVIVVALPFILSGLWEADLSLPPGAPAAALPPQELAIGRLCPHRLARCGAAGYVRGLNPRADPAYGGGDAFGRAAPSPPSEAIWAAQFFIGMSVGANTPGSQ